MDNDIVARMRKHASLSGLHTFEGTKEERKAEFNRMRSVANSPSSEIVARLRAMAWLAQCSDDQKSHLVQAAAEIERLRAELKKTHRHYGHLLMQFVSEANAARRSNAPTPANTGGGADHQIPEAL